MSSRTVSRLEIGAVPGSPTDFPWPKESPCVYYTAVPKFTCCLPWILGFKCGEKNAESLEGKEEAESSVLRLGFGNVGASVRRRDA